MLVALHRERSVPTLVDMAQSRIASVLLPPPHVSDRQALREGRQLAIALRPQQHVPVVRHQRIRTNPHRPFIDEITFDCPTCGTTATRVPEVIDTWYDSGAMPFAQWGYHPELG